MKLKRGFMKRDKLEVLLTKIKSLENCSNTKVLDILSLKENILESLIKFDENDFQKVCLVVLALAKGRKKFHQDTVLKCLDLLYEAENMANWKFNNMCDVAVNKNELLSYEDNFLKAFNLLLETSTKEGVKFLSCSFIREVYPANLFEIAEIVKGIPQEEEYKISYISDVYNKILKLNDKNYKNKLVSYINMILKCPNKEVIGDLCYVLFNENTMKFQTNEAIAKLISEQKDARVSASIRLVGTYKIANVYGLTLSATSIAASLNYVSRDNPIDTILTDDRLYIRELAIPMAKALNTFTDPNIYKLIFCLLYADILFCYQYFDIIVALSSIIIGLNVEDNINSLKHIFENNPLAPFITHLQLLLDKYVSDYDFYTKSIDILNNILTPNLGVYLEKLPMTNSSVKNECPLKTSVIDEAISCFSETVDEDIDVLQLSKRARIRVKMSKGDIK